MILNPSCLGEVFVRQYRLVQNDVLIRIATVSLMKANRAVDINRCRSFSKQIVLWLIGCLQWDDLRSTVPVNLLSNS